MMPSRKTATVIATLGMLLLGVPTVADCQTDTATITGLVTDPSGAAVAGAVIEAVNQATGLSYTTRSNVSGIYVLTALPIGRYDLTASSQGFQMLRRPNITLNAGTRARVDVGLKVGAVTEVLEVTAAVPLLESETSELSQVVENKTITQMPLNGRNYQQLAVLSPGVLPSRTRNFVEDAFSVNGANMWQNQFVLDGMDNTNYMSGVVIASNEVVKPSIDAIQEFKMETHNFGAEFGRGGGAVVQVTTKSGTNAFHGTAFEFLRNDKLDANNFFNSGRPKPPYRQNQFGGTFGGPVIRDRTFFFGSYQGTRIREKITRLNTIPTPAMVGGDFSGAANIFDPATQAANGARQAFPNNMIPNSRIDPVAIRVLELYPAPNRTSVQNYVFNASRNLDDEQVDTRFDHRFTESDSIFLRYSYHNFDRLEPGNLPLPASGGNTAMRTARAHSAVLNETHIFGNGTMVNEFRLAYSRNVGGIDTPTREQLWKEYGFKGLFDREDIRGLPWFSLAGYTNIGDRSFAPDPRKADVRQIVENLSWNKGKHAIKFGTNMRFFIRWAGITNFARGRFLFNGQFTSATAGKGRGDAFADALLGLTNNTRLSTPVNVRRHSRAYEFFVQDNYKVTPKLTLNLGFRYEYQTPFWEQNDRAQNFVIDPASPDFGTLVPIRGDSVEDRSFEKRDLNNFAPRIGFAFQATDKTVVRASYGIFYDVTAQLPFGSQPTQNPPFYLQVDIPTANSNPVTNIRVQDGFPADALNPNVLEGRSIAAVWPFDYPDGITHQWNFNLQQSLPGNSAFSVAYVGTNTVHRRLGSVQINQPSPGPGALNPRRAFPNFSDIAMDVPIGTANYQGLELKFERRFSGGFSVLSGYTWSHSMIGTVGQNSTILAPEKNLSPEDLRHRFFTAAVWDLPLGRGRHWANTGAISHIVGGWQISPIFTAQTGLPFTPGVAGNPANTTGGQRPDRIGDGNLPRGERTPERWFDVGAFVVPERFTFGNSGANILEGPGLVNLDVTVARTFRFNERISLDFRTEFFNIMNEAHFLFPNATINTGPAGTISQTSDSARQIQFGMKLIF